jgi:hypothetical protein
MNRKLLPALRTVGAGIASGRPLAEPKALVKAREGREIAIDHESSRGRPGI